MPKDENALPNPSAISDYPDLISDTSVVFGQAKIIPDVVENVGDAANVVVRFGETVVENGLELGLDDIAVEPKIEITRCNHQDIYTLLLVDPDAPTPVNPKYKDTLYWMVTNIKGARIDDADFAVEYMPPEPAQNVHRYVFLLFRHPHNNLITVNVPSRRIGFQTRDFAKHHGLGNPVWGLYFKCRHK